ncbi:RNA polymerase sigma-70 factor [Flavivirga sp. 57AJ16]|uniref:RNA polymerase sigma-70 factor n=1 Tax=Flavivirga sp. 57AJ16 TaxID=3025307 RepID=UPI002366E655|nr:RNA polymerase sigma-70 factor [Flavivirga sp. 57AJ16]MDD7885088.1 RNA polymerase sigma-70 factor [Flavivirga sp. 57AJ16]
MSVAQNHTDQQLIDRINANDEGAFNTLYDLYWESLFIYAHNLLKDRVLAEDILQDIFINIWTKRGDINVKTTLKGYLYTSVMYKVYDQFRKNKQSFKEELLDNFNQRIQTSNPESKLIYQELLEHINRTVETFPDKIKEVFILSRQEQLTHKEIAEKLGISTKTVEAHITKALKLLKASISNIAGMELIIFISYYMHQ